MSIKIVVVALSSAIPVAEAYEQFDQAVTYSQGVELLAFQEADFSNLSDAQGLCKCISHDKTGWAGQ